MRKEKQEKEDRFACIKNSRIKDKRKSGDTEKDINSNYKARKENRKTYTNKKEKEGRI